MSRTEGGNWFVLVLCGNDLLCRMKRATDRFPLQHRDIVFKCFTKYTSLFEYVEIKKKKKILTAVPHRFLKTTLENTDHYSEMFGCNKKSRLRTTMLLKAAK